VYGGLWYARVATALDPWLGFKVLPWHLIGAAIAAPSHLPFISPYSLSHSLSLSLSLSHFALEQQNVSTELPQKKNTLID